MRRDITTIVVGLLFLAAGILIGGSMLGYFDFTINFDGWWTLFLIVPALLTMIQGGVNAGNIILLGIGGIFLLDAQDVLPANFTWKLIFPVVLLAVGFQLLFGGQCRSRKTDAHHDQRRDGQNGPDGASFSGGTNDGAYSEKQGKTGGGGMYTERSRSGNSYKTASVFLGGQDVLYGNEDFSGGSYTAIFGGLTVNMRNVILSGDVVINVTAIFGGIDIILPPNVQVVSNLVPILGGMDNKYPSSNDPNAPKIIINGTASFGGVDVK